MFILSGDFSYPAVGDGQLLTREGFRDKLVRRKNAVLSALKGWVCFEVTKLLKLALPIVS